MKRTSYQEETYQMKFKDYYERFCSKHLTAHEASELLGISERTFLRKKMLIFKMFI